ncbi:MAG: 4-amino-4-deoxy-L-arabinose transferase-like glycosyltransferase [Pseudohongiellaceae bacterium]|jgi:4-amino-4-deoxy-L-arabinose transferase-like glycosyltransferase
MLAPVAKRIFLGTFCGLLVLRLLAAAQLDLFGDEAFYWQCSQNMAWGYADHPFMTALLVRAGSTFFGPSTLAMRAPFLALGGATTVLLLCLGRRLLCQQEALRGATFSLLLPALALSTFMALPDVPLMFFELAGLVACQRAVEVDATPKQRLCWWTLAGFCAALALSTHARGALLPVAVGLWLLSCPRGRRQLATVAPWWGLACAMVGLVPSLLFNMEHDFAQWRYQLSDRHGALAADPGQLLDHLAEQAAVVTPLLYVALLACLVEALKRARRGDDRWGLVACFSLAHLGVFFLASPFSDRAHTSLHWPLPGYLPLCLLLPCVLGRWARGALVWRFLGGASWRLAALVVAVLVVDLGTGVLGLPWISAPFAGWSEMTARAQQHWGELSAASASSGSSNAPVVVGDHYYVAAQLQRALPSGERTYTLDHPILNKHGRAFQYELWGQDEAGLADLSGSQALLVVDWSAVRSRDREGWLEHLQDQFADLRELSSLSLSLPGEERNFSFYSGQLSEPGRDQKAPR